MGRLNKEQIEFIKNNVDKLTNREIAKSLGCNESTISNWRKKLNISFSDLHDFSEYNQYIIENYNLKTAKKLAEEIGCSKAYVTKIWSKANLKGKTNRVYYSNFEYFQTINTANKAYILGLICSDGCIYKRKNHEGIVQITLQKQDKDLLNLIKKEINSDNPIKENGEYSTLTIVSEQMYQDLIKIGIVPKKTYTIILDKVIENIPLIYRKDFLHGYFDGDGSITVRDVPSKSKVQFAIPEHSKDILQNLLLSYNIQSHWSRDNREEKYTIPFSNIVIDGTSNKYCFLRLIYLEDTISLKRKSQLSQQLCQQIQSNKTNRKENIIAVEKWEELLENLRR